MMDFLTVFSTFFFFTEMYHIIGHAVILFGIRTIPLRDLEKIGAYFVTDLLSVTFSWLIHGQFSTIVAIQQVQHIFYIVTWNKGYMAKRVAFWSSLDWYTNKGKSRAFEWIGTFYDLATHCLMVYSLYPYVSLNIGNIAVALLMLYISARNIIFNPKSAWASPKAIPEWVQKRCTAQDVY